MRHRRLLRQQSTVWRQTTCDTMVWPAAIVQAAVGRNPFCGCGETPTPRETVAPEGGVAYSLSLCATPPVAPPTEHGLASNNLRYNGMARSYRSSRCGAKSVIIYYSICHPTIGGDSTNILLNFTTLLLFDTYMYTASTTLRTTYMCYLMLSSCV